MKCYNIPEFDFINDVGMYSKYYLIYAQFNFKKYKEIRKKEHPEWSERQIGCVLYWQNSIKRLLKQYIEKIRKNTFSLFYIFGCGSGFNLTFQKTTYSMEAATINVFSTCKLNGIKLEIKPQNIIHLVCLLCAEVPIIFEEKNKKVTLEAYL